VSGGNRAGGIEEGQLEAAEADLLRIREALAAAARGELDASGLTRSMKEYLEQHGPVLRSAATAVGEEVRRGLLEQLYGWRSQLDDQLGSHRRAPEPDEEADPS
jgi:hypothetical protein